MDPKSFLEQGVHVEEMAFEEVINVKVDHPYSAMELTPIIVMGPSGVLPAPSSQWQSFKTTDRL